MASSFDCVDHNKLWKILKEMVIPNHHACLLRNLYVNREISEPDMEKQTGLILGKEYDKAVYCHPAFNLYAEYIAQSAGLDDSQARIKIARRNFNNLRYAVCRYADMIPSLMAESKGELLMRVKKRVKKLP